MNKRRLLIGAIAVGAIVFLSLLIAYFAGRYAQKLIEKKSDNIAGLAIEVGSFEADIINARLALNKIKIYPAGDKREAVMLASADRLFVSVDVMDAFSGELHVKEVKLMSPKINYVRVGKSKYNWDALDLGESDEGKGEEEKEKPEKEEPLKLQVDSAVIENGFVKYRDSLKGQRLDLKNLDASATNIVTEKDPKKLPTKIKMRAQIDDTSGTLAVDGRANFFAEGINFEMSSKLSNAPLTYFAPFYAGSVPFGIRAGTLDVKSKADCQKSKLVAHNNITLTGLRADDSLKGRLVNNFVLKNAKPININATVQGDLDRGNFYVSAAITDAVVKNLMEQAKDATPVGRAVESVKKSIQKIFGR